MINNLPQISERMLSIYKKHKRMDRQLVIQRAFNVLKCTLFLGALFFVMGTPAMAQEALYVVEDQAVDVTADNPVQARENAILEAQRSAFDVLAQRMLPEDEYKALPNFSDDVVASLVKDFSVKGERTSSTRYTALFTLRFDGPRVERVFGLTGIAYSDVASQPVVVLPFLQMGTRLMIWEEPNPWREVWQNAVLDDGLVPIRVPLGDIADMADVPDASIFSGQAGNLTAIADRYGAANVLLVVAKSRGAALEASEGVLLTLYTASGSGVERINELMVPAGQGATFSQAMNDVVAYIRNDWKQQTTNIDTVNTSNVAVQASFTGLPEWIDIKQRLEGVSLVDSINTDTMTHNRADLMIEYTGSLEGLRLALLQNGLTLSQTVLDSSGYLLKLQDASYNY